MNHRWKKDKEYMSYVSDLLERDEVKQLKAYNHHYYNNRLDHSIAVSYYSYLLAKKLNANAKAVARAGLLHDMYYYDREHSKEVLNGRSHNATHPKIATKNAERITTLSDLEKDIIEKHMWGATKQFPKYKESYIVTLVDKYCAMTDLAIPLTSKMKRKYHHQRSYLRRSL